MLIASPSLLLCHWHFRYGKVYTRTVSARCTTLWRECNSCLKPNPRYDYFYNNIQAPQLKPYHFHPTLSDGNIEHVYGKLRPRAVRHTSVMAPAFTIAVWMEVGGELYRQLHNEVKGYLTLDSFLSKGNVTEWLQAGSELFWSMILTDLTLFPGGLGHCFFFCFFVAFCNLGSSQSHLKCVSERPRKRLWVAMMLLDDLALNLNSRATCMYLNGAYIDVLL